jgi:hypothetical protein
VRLSFKERRRKISEPTKLHRKSGVWGTRRLVRPYSTAESVSTHTGRPLGPALVPRIDDGNTGMLEMLRIPGSHRETVCCRGRSNIGAGRGHRAACLGSAHNDLGQLLRGIYIKRTLFGDDAFRGRTEFPPNQRRAHTTANPRESVSSLDA